VGSEGPSVNDSIADDADPDPPGHRRSPVRPAVVIARYGTRSAMSAAEWALSRSDVEW
jgi:hypothetical protein